MDLPFQFKTIQLGHVDVGQNKKGHNRILIQVIQRFFRIKKKNDLISRINFPENGLQDFLVVDVIFNDDDRAFLFIKQS